jgi:hypothetical protein
MENPTRDDVVARITHDFPSEEPARLLTILDEYGTQSYERERERIQLAILHLRKGDIEEARAYTKAAKRDYRDVLLWSSDSRPALNAAEAQLFLERFKKMFPKQDV